MEEIIFEEYKNELVDAIEDRLEFSLMTPVESRFLNGLIQYYKPKKILEIGVAAGASSAVILSAIKEMEGAKLYSIDLAKYRANDKAVGHLVGEKFSELLPSWKLYTGGIASRFMEDIGGEIDLVLLDAAHVNPGEILDFLMIKPFLKKNAIIIIHDISLHLLHIDAYKETCAILFSALRGEIFIPRSSGFANIGAVRLEEITDKDVWKYFHLLTLEWNSYDFFRTMRVRNIDMHISKEDFEFLTTYFKKYYNSEYVGYFKQIYLKQAANINLYPRLVAGKSIIYAFLFYPIYIYRKHKIKSFRKFSGKKESKLSQALKAYLFWPIYAIKLLNYYIM